MCQHAEMQYINDFFDYPFFFSQMFHVLNLVNNVLDRSDK